MWNPTTPTEKKPNNTAAAAAAKTETSLSDNKNKGEVGVDACSCSGAQQEQLQKLNLVEQPNSKKQKVTSTIIGGNLSNTGAGADADAGAVSASVGNTPKTLSSSIKSADKEYLVVEQTADSGFISGPQSEPIYDEEEDFTKSATTTTSATTTENKGTNVLNEKEGDAIDDSEKIQNLTEGVLDSGCIDDDVGNIEHEVATKVAGAAATQSKNITDAQQVQRATSTNTADQMKFEHNIDVGISDWMCQTQNDVTATTGSGLNNLSGRRKASLTSSANISYNKQPHLSQQQQQQYQQQQQSATHNLSIPPWEQFYQQNDDGDTPLHLSCISGDVDIVTALIRMAPHPCLFNIQNDEAQTPLHLATLTAQPNICRMLLLAGAEPTIRDRNGNTALHLACIAGEKQCVRALTETLGASEIHEAHRHYGHRSNDKAFSSLSYARLPSDLEIRNYDGERCVHLAAQGGYIDILRILVSHGADINAREGKSGRTPLHIAIECRNEDLANFLLDECEKLNLETATYAGLTAYQVAQILDNTQMKDILEKRGAEPLTPPDSDYDYDSSDIEDLDDTKLYDRFGDPKYFVNYGSGVNPMTVA